MPCSSEPQLACTERRAATPGVAACPPLRLPALAPFAAYAGREGLRRLRDLAVETGRKLIGTACGLVPEELLLASGALPVRLCGGEPPDPAAGLPRDICPVAAAALWPLREGLVDAALLPLSCDWKAHLADLAATEVPVLRLSLPRDAALPLAADELRRLALELADLTDVALTRGGYAEARRQVAEADEALRQLQAARAGLLAEEALLVQDSRLRADPLRWAEAVRALLVELSAQPSAPLAHAPRVLLAGSPIIYPNTKVPRLLEESGAVVAGEAFCGRSEVLLAATSAPANGDPCAEMARRLQARCACGLGGRPAGGWDAVLRSAEAFGADGVVVHVLKGCAPFHADAARLAAALRAAGRPALVLETDHGSEDVEGLRTRVETFVRMMEARKEAL